MAIESTPTHSSKPALVSVVLPVYNGAEYLDECIKSILGSSYSAIELIIINDASTDSSAQIIDMYAKNNPRIIVLQNADNRGLPESLNTAVLHAKGKYIARVNQDDLIDPRRIEAQIAYLSAHGETVCLGTAATYIDEHGNDMGKTLSLPRDDSSLRNKWKYSSPFADPTVMYLREAAISAGLYDSGYWPADDSQFWYRLGQEGKLANLPETLTKIRIHSKAISHARFRKMAYQIYRTRRYLHAHIQPVSIPVQLFWICQLIACFLLPQKLNWAIYHAIIRSYSK